MERLNLDLDTELNQNSNTIAPSQRAIKTYVDNRHILLKFMQSTDPTDFNVGDKWLNTSSNIIFTALTINTWDGGKIAKEGQFYTFNNELYYFNGMSVVKYPTGGGEGGTSDYTELTNKPSINNIELVGNKTLDSLGIQAKGDYASSSDIPTNVSDLNNDSNFITREAKATATEYGTVKLEWDASTGTLNILN